MICRWWLNAWCAYRDGIVGSPTQAITEGQSRVVTALMLLSGTEVDGPVPGTYEYSIDGKAADMKFNLLTQHGKPIRVLRGSQLKSKYAPEGGIRYDGLYVSTMMFISPIFTNVIRYTMDSHSHKIVNPHTNTYRLKLTLKRCEGQLPFEQLQIIPLPSQMDEWEMYNKLVDKDFRACYGDEADYASWKDNQEAEKREKRVWLETQAFKDVQRTSNPHYAGH
ncbi:PUA-like domain-containing protein [Tricladium varicosporioides]|nr:PUA-like domain-containing protein [Hymenoscyphus varicosporioides]